VCSRDVYESTFAPALRAKAMKWLKLHAKYDDTHPWEALEIICTLLGRQPTRRYYELVRSRVLTSYRYMRLTLDQCLESRMTPLRPAPEADRNYPAHCERA